MCWVSAYSVFGIQLCNGCRLTQCLRLSYVTGVYLVSVWNSVMWRVVSVWDSVMLWVSAYSVFGILLCYGCLLTQCLGYCYVMGVVLLSVWDSVMLWVSAFSVFGILLCYGCLLSQCLGYCYVTGVYLVSVWDTVMLWVSAFSVFWILLCDWCLLSQCLGYCYVTGVYLVSVWDTVMWRVSTYSVFGILLCNGCPLAQPVYVSDKRCIAYLAFYAFSSVSLIDSPEGGVGKKESTNNIRMTDVTTSGQPEAVAHASESW